MPWTAEDDAELKAIEQEAEQAEQPEQEEGQEEPDNAGGEEPQEEQGEEGTSPDSSPGKEEKEEAQPEEEELDPEDKELINNQDLSRKTRKRLQELSKEAKRAKELERELEALKSGKQPEKQEEEDPFDHGKQKPKTPQQESGKMPWEEKEELDLNDIREITRKEAAQIYQERQELETFATSIKSDVKSVEQEYPQLNADSEQYSPKLDQHIARGYQIALKSYPRLSFKKYVDTEMEAIREAVEKSQQDLKSTLRKQEDDQAMPTGGGTPKGGKLSDTDLDKMSLEEMEAILPKASNYDTF